MKNSLKLFVLSLISVLASCTKEEGTLPVLETDISSLVGTWDKANTVRITITADGTFTAQRWVAAASSYANNYAVYGKVTRSGELITVNVEKSNLAHLWSRESLSTIALKYSAVGDVVTFSEVSLIPGNLDVRVAVIDRLTGAFTKNNAPTTALPMENFKFSLKPRTLPAPGSSPTLSSFTYVNGVFNFTVQNYTFGIPTSDQSTQGLAFSPMGQHVHLIIDGQPYLAAGNPYTYAAGLTDGEHTIVAFLSRSYHESFKNPEALIEGKFMVVGNSIVGTISTSNITTDEVWGSRPIRTYTGATEYSKILLDYIISGSAKAKLGSTYSVRYTINQTPWLLETWDAALLEGLNRYSAAGVTHNVKVELYNKTTKSIVKTVDQTFLVKD